MSIFCSQATLAVPFLNLATERDKELADTKLEELNGAVSKKAQTHPSGEAISRCFLNCKDTIARFFNSGLGG